MKIEKYFYFLLMMIFVLGVGCLSEVETDADPTENYTLTANANGGSIPSTADWTGTGNTATKDINYGVAYGTLPTPTWENHKFLGWFTAAQNGDAVSSTTTMPAENTTIYAHWEEIKTLTMNPNGGKINDSTNPDTHNMYQDDTYNVPIPTRTGHTFAGWYDAAENGNAVTTNPYTMGFASQTIYAHWTINDYTLTLDGNGGTFTTVTGWTLGQDNETTTKSYTYNTAYGTLPEPTWTNHKFLGWFTAAQNGDAVSSATTMPAENTTIYAHWEEIKTLTMNPNAGKINDSTSPATHNMYQGDTYNVPIPTRTGHTFAGWYDAAENGNAVTTDPYTMDSASQTIYAHWTVNNYTLTLNGNGGTIANANGWTAGENNATTTKTYDYDTEYGALPTASKENHKFLGWFTDRTNGQKVTASTKMPAENTTLYAHWEEGKHLTINPNGGTVNLTSKYPLYEGDAYAELPTPTRQGYTFDNWYDAAENGNTVSAATTMGNTDAIIYAHWNYNGFVVIYNSDGSTETMENSVFDVDVANTLKLNAYTKPGYVFDHWTDGQGNEYEDGETINANTYQVGDEITLTPVFRNKTTSYTPTDSDGFVFKTFFIMDQGDTVPEATFSFSVSPGTAIPLNASNNTMAIYAGIGTPTVTSVTFGPNDTTSTSAGNNLDVARAASARASGLTAATGVELESGEKYATKEATVSFTGIEFTEPGIYRYIISETADSNHASAGIMHDNDTDRVLDVYVIDNDGALEIASYVFHTTAGNVQMSETNGSGDVNTNGAPVPDKTDGFTNEYNSKDLRISKTVSGNQASKDKYFDFTITVSGVKDADVYTISLSNDNDNNTNDGDASARTTINSATIETNQDKANPTSCTGAQLKAGLHFYLQHNQNIVVRGLPLDAVYTVRENAEDYKSTVPSGKTNTGTIGTVAASTKTAEAGFSNIRNGIIPTGVATSVTGGLILILFSIGGYVLLSLKKKENYN